MPKKRPSLTPAVEKVIVAYVRAGGYPHVAAEAAGIPREVFDDWLRKGEAGRPLKYKQFVEALHQAEAQARLNAEVAALKDKPMDWLRAGPGKETAAKPGWSALAKPRRRREGNTAADALRRASASPRPAASAGAAPGSPRRRRRLAQRVARGRREDLVQGQESICVNVRAAHAAQRSKRGQPAYSAALRAQARTNLEMEVR